MKIACALLLALGAVTGARAQDDPLKSPACGAALSRLQAARGDADAAADVQALRSAAATTCLGTSAPPTRPGRVLQAPVVVPPPQIDVPQHAAPLPAPSLPPPPVAIQRPPSPALCDAGGCWSNDGAQLRYVPPLQVGRPGGCIPQAGLVYCP